MPHIVTFNTNTTHRDNMKRIFAVLILAVGLQACSKSNNAPSSQDIESEPTVSVAPSAQDVESALKSGYAECSNLSIENVKLINGLKIDDLTHQVKAQFDIRIIPLPADVIEEARKTNEQVGAEIKTRDEKHAELEKQQSDLDQQRFHLEDQRSAELNSMHFKMNEYGVADQSEVNAANAELDKKYGQQIRQLLDEKAALYDQIIRTSNLVTTKSVNLRDLWGSQACQSKSGVAFGGSGADMTSVVENGQVTSYEATFVMIKTDNGWMKAQ